MEEDPLALNIPGVKLTPMSGGRYVGNNGRVYDSSGNVISSVNTADRGQSYYGGSRNSGGGGSPTVPFSAPSPPVAPSPSTPSRPTASSPVPPSLAAVATPNPALDKGLPGNPYNPGSGPWSSWNAAHQPGSTPSAFNNWGMDTATPPPKQMPAVHSTGNLALDLINAGHPELAASIANDPLLQRNAGTISQNMADIAAGKRNPPPPPPPPASPSAGGAAPSAGGSPSAPGSSGDTTSGGSSSSGALGQATDQYNKAYAALQQLQSLLTGAGSTAMQSLPSALQALGQSILQGQQAQQNILPMAQQLANNLTTPTNLQSILSNPAFQSAGLSQAQQVLQSILGQVGPQGQAIQNMAQQVAQQLQTPLFGSPLERQQINQYVDQLRQQEQGSFMSGLQDLAARGAIHGGGAAGLLQNLSQDQAQKAAQYISNLTTSDLASQPARLQAALQALVTGSQMPQQLALNAAQASGNMAQLLQNMGLQSQGFQDQRNLQALNSLIQGYQVPFTLNQDALNNALGLLSQGSGLLGQAGSIGGGALSNSSSLMQSIMNMQSQVAALQAQSKAYQSMLGSGGLASMFGGAVPAAAGGSGSGTSTGTDNTAGAPGADNYVGNTGLPASYFGATPGSDSSNY